MWSQQIFVAFLCIFVSTQQVIAVVNSGQSSKAEEPSKTTNVESSESSKDSASSENVQDSVAAGSEEANRREAPLGLADTYGVPVPSDTYLPTGPSNVNLPVPVYGVPDATSNNIVYPAPPPDIPPPVALPLQTYGVPQVNFPLASYGPPLSSSLISPSGTYGAPALTYGVPNLSLPPKYTIPRGSKPKPNYGPPRPLYGPPKFGPKKHFPKYRPTKPIGVYGPPTVVNVPFKDNYSATKLNINSNHGNFLSAGYGQTSFSSHASLGGGHSISAQYGTPLDTSLLGVGFGTSLASQSLVGHSIGGHSIGGHSLGSHSLSTQYGAPPDTNLLGPIHTSAHYGPPEPSPNPQPPHPGAPAPPTPPDIKYDGWQPIPGLVSRRPSDTYGVPLTDNHIAGDLSYNNDLSPPPLTGHGGSSGHDVSIVSGAHSSASLSLTGHGVSSGHDISISSGGHDISHGHGTGSLGLSNTYGIPQGGVSDSYGAPLNTVTGSGGIVASSGDDIHNTGQDHTQHHSHVHSHTHSHAQHQHHHHEHHSGGALALGLSGLGGDGTIQSIKSVGYEIFPNGGGISGGGISGGGIHGSISDSYGAPPLDSYATGGPYAAGHSYSNQGLSFGGSFASSHHSHNSHHSHGSFNSHRGYKGLSLSSSGIGLIPPSGVYGAPSGQYGTPLFSSQSKQPIVLGGPLPTGLLTTDFGKQSSGYSSHSTSIGSSYLPPSADLTKPPEPTTLYSLPLENSAVSFQNLAHGSSVSGLTSFNSALNVDGAHAQALSSYNVPLGVVDGSYSSTNHGNNIQPVGIDNSHPPLNIDLTGGLLQGNHYQANYALQNNLHTGIPHDCSLHKSQPLPSLSYGVPSANSYTASLSSLTTNIGGSYNVPVQPHATYGVPDLAASHSQKSEIRANSIQESDNKEVDDDTHAKTYGKSVAESFGPNSELIKSQSIDLNNIPVQGSLGSYTLQIQSSNGETPQVPHTQVLNDGLLQSILAAIEQPQKSGNTILGQPVAQLQPLTNEQYLQVNQSLDARNAGSYQNSELEFVSSDKVSQIVSSETQEQNHDAEVSESKNEEVTETPLKLLDDNEIALYYSNNNNNRYKKQTEGEANSGENQSKSMEDKDVVTNSH